MWTDVTHPHKLAMHFILMFLLSIPCFKESHYIWICRRYSPRYYVRLEHQRADVAECRSPQLIRATVCEQRASCTRAGLQRSAATVGTSWVQIEREPMTPCVGISPWRLLILGPETVEMAWPARTALVSYMGLGLTGTGSAGGTWKWVRLLVSIFQLNKGTC